MADDIIKIDNWSNIAKLDDGNGVIMPFIQELFLIECRIAGTSFVEDMEERAKLRKQMCDLARMALMKNHYQPWYEDRYGQISS